MSLAAYTWAASLPLDVCPIAPFRVLLQLADRADELGYGAYPSVETIADKLGCSARTVQRALRALVASDLIREGDQRYVQHIPPRYRPTVYDVLTTALRATENRGDSLVTPQSVRGDRSGHSGVTTVVTQTVQEPTYQDSLSEPPVPERASEQQSQPVSIGRSGRGHAHDFDPVSGYCRGCSYRDDGRLVGPGGGVFQQGPNDAEEAHAS